MAILAQTGVASQVHGVGEARAANVSLSSGIMEMLATTYTYIMMAAIRESVQNACDASRRAGLSFSEGVLVTLPTAENPMVTVQDKGSGMTKEFMESDKGYMSFGESTKAGSNDELGGLGVGRWAAYGYIRECVVKTTHASDMVERSYFQYQGPGNMPLVAPAQERPGMTQTGTMVSFPVRKEDVEEAQRAVAWLKAIMQLTMGDSFTVDAPAALISATAGAGLALPAYSGVTLELETVDPALAGVRVHAMSGPNLQYGPKTLMPGSLVVVTNHERGVGGLPFHATATGESAFLAGMIIEIPMTFRVPFMPSRETVKYTPEFNALMDTIDAAARRAAVAKAKELYSTPGLSSKQLLTSLVAASNGSFISLAMHSRETPFGAELKRAVGNCAWVGTMSVQGFDPTLRTTIKVRAGYGEPLKSTYISSEVLYIPNGGDKPAEEVRFGILQPPTLVVNDLASGGVARFREWAKPRNEKLILISAEDPADAFAQAKAVNAFFGNELASVKTSDFPAGAKRVIRGSSGGRATATNMVFHGVSSSEYDTGKQGTESISFISPLGCSKGRVWIGKEGRLVDGLSSDHSFGDLINKNLERVLAAAKFDRIYLLSGKQVKELTRLTELVKEADAWDASEEEFSDLEIDLTYGEVQSLKGWIHFEEVATQLTGQPGVRAVLDGTHLHTVVDHSAFNLLVENLKVSPRMALTGTRLDKALAPSFDILTGERKLPRAKVETTLLQVCLGLANYGTCMEIAASDTEARKLLKDELMSLTTKGKLEIKSIWEQLVAEFPMVSYLATKAPANCVDDLVEGMSVIYR